RTGYKSSTADFSAPVHRFGIGFAVQQPHLATNANPWRWRDAGVLMTSKQDIVQPKEMLWILL
ncbi:MAG TPA: hypothetical protein DCG12_14215, partial [Planctomycetaceae bacterium]|nr:hypothetical protein [Planctomycetaceae bacterium]